jgi:hypothetical protein
MYMVSLISRAFDGTKREFSKLKYEKAVTTSFTVSHTFHLDLDSGSFVPQEESASSAITIEENETLEGTNIGPRSAEIHPMTRAERKEINYKKTSTLKNLPQTYRPAVIHLDEIGRTRWQLASSFMRAQSKPGVTFINPVDKEFFVNEAPNWPSGAGFIPKSSYSIFSSIALAVGLYNGLRACA